MVSEALIAGRNALQKSIGLMLDGTIDGQAEIAEAFGLEANGARVDAQNLQRPAELQGGAVEDCGIEGADAQVEGGFDHGDDVPLDIDGAATGSRAEAKTVAAEGEAISGNFSNGWHELSRISGQMALDLSDLIRSAAGPRDRLIDSQV